MTDSAVTLPLKEKDIVLVHSVHTNGWADGTLLKDGSRGWLPTNYCVPYNPEEMRILLGALVSFWDLMRCACIDSRELFNGNKFMKGIAGGVRYLLVRCQRPSIYILLSPANTLTGAHWVSAERLLNSATTC